MNTPKWVVREVEPRDDYSLLLTFADGTKKPFDAHPLLEKPVFSDLKNIVFFLSAKVDCGTVVWNDEIDIAPEYLYECGLPAEEFDNA